MAVTWTHGKLCLLVLIKCKHPWVLILGLILCSVVQPLFWRQWAARQHLQLHTLYADRQLLQWLVQMHHWTHRVGDKLALGVFNLAKDENSLKRWFHFANIVLSKRSYQFTLSTQSFWNHIFMFTMKGLNKPSGSNSLTESLSTDLFVGGSWRTCIRGCLSYYDVRTSPFF